MSILVVAVLRITDAECYARYADAFPVVFARHEGAIIAADPSPHRLEDAPADKIVIMSFPDLPAARGFLEDPEYQAISADRRKGAVVDAWLVQSYS